MLMDRVAFALNERGGRQAIARWVKLEWPRVKKTPDAAMPGSASKTSRGSASYLL
jgi:hypothetical protein